MTIKQTLQKDSYTDTLGYHCSDVKKRMDSLCQGICASGLQCRRRTCESFCHQHKNQIVERTKDECGICLDNIHTEFKFNCGHKFCTCCASKWLISCKQMATCPNCRAELDGRSVFLLIAWSATNKLIARRRHCLVEISNLVFENINDQHFINSLLKEKLSLDKEEFQRIIIPLLLRSDKYLSINRLSNKTEFIYYRIEHPKEADKWIDNPLYSFC